MAEPDFNVRTEQDEIELREGQPGTFRVFILSPFPDRPPPDGTYYLETTIDAPDEGLSIEGPSTIDVQGGTPNFAEFTLNTDDAFDEDDPTTVRRDVQIRVKVTDDREGPPRETTTRFTIFRDVDPGFVSPTTVQLMRSRIAVDENAFLWPWIEYSTEALSFREYEKIIDLLLCPHDQTHARKEVLTDNRYQALLKFRCTPFNNMDAYRYLKVATEAFVVVNSMVPIRIDDYVHMIDPAMLYRLRDKAELAESSQQIFQRFRNSVLASMNGSPDPILPLMALLHRNLGRLEFASFDDDMSRHAACYEVLREKLLRPCMLELIWSYWHEEGMQVQTMLAIRNRFQNVPAESAPDPLAHMEVAPLRPLGSYLWGYIQDEQHRLTLARRFLEYGHQYGFTLQGKAVPPVRPADSRSKFLEALNNLLYLCSQFYKEDADTTKIADAFPVLNAIKEVHYLLSEGAHNQYGDLPSTARQEMLMEQWLLSRPEMQQFLPKREMMPYPEGWMGAVDSMKSVQGWTDTSIIYFHDLAVFGEQILLGIRFGHWSEINDPGSAKIWARYWRAKIQGYIHAYRTVTGIDLSTEPADTQERAARSQSPSMLLARRLQEKRLAPGLPAQSRLPPSPTAGRWALARPAQRKA
ncbi:MAG: hypothetical protein L0211_16075 [Planctomycetaceae bacterium]|nr:hypothetical protein [Planctomycetaceae bacterium]